MTSCSVCVLLDCTYCIVRMCHYRNLKTKEVELELLEVKLAQKSIAVAQERENNMAERQCVSVTIVCHSY